MSSNDLSAMVANTKLGFHKFSEGKTIVNEGTPCADIMILLDGTMNIASMADDHSYEITETINAPYVMQPERVFGLHQRFTKTFKSASACNFISIGKDEIRKLTDEFLVFKLNILNIISAQAQKSDRVLWKPAPYSLRERIIRFVQDRCLYPAGQKNIRITMNQLAAQMNDSRLDISNTLNAMQKEGLISLRRGYINIPALEKLIIRD